MKLLFCLLLGTMAYADDVVVNKQAKGKPVTIKFTEELRIGPETHEDYGFWTGSQVMVSINSKGHMFVVDALGSRILQFAPDGSFVRQIGQKGSGPGEFMALTGFDILDDDSGIAYENRQGRPVFHFFDKDMKFVKTDQKTGLRTAFISLSWAPDGKKVRAFSIFNNDQGQFVESVVMNPELKSLVSLAKNPVPDFIGQRASDPAYLSEFFSHWFRLIPKGQGIIAFGPDSSVFTAQSDKYEITKLDANLKPKATFTTKYKPSVLSAEEQDEMLEPIRAEVLSAFPPNFQKIITDNVIAKAVEMAEFPESKPPLYGLIPLEDGGVLAVSAYNAISKEAKADIFDKNGHYRGKTNLPKVAVNTFGSYHGNYVKLIFKGGKAYGIAENDEDLTLVRYKYEIVPAN